MVDRLADNADQPVGDELHASPPFLTWGGIYLIVLGALAAEIAGFAALTALCR